MTPAKNEHILSVDRMLTSVVRARVETDTASRADPIHYGRRRSNGRAANRAQACNAGETIYTGMPMTKAAVAELLKLRPEERLEIAQLLWESVEPEEEARFLSIPEWQREVLRERLEDLELRPNDEEPWEKVKAELWPDA